MKLETESHDLPNKQAEEYRQRLRVLSFRDGEIDHYMKSNRRLLYVIVTLQIFAILLELFQR